MQRCPNCKVTVAGHKACCPLCGGRLSGTPEPDTEVFPSLEKPRFTGSFALRLLGLLAIAVTVVCLLVNLALGMDDWWWIFVAVGACGRPRRLALPTGGILRRISAGRCC